jgi:hypothetical protein
LTFVARLFTAFAGFVTTFSKTSALERRNGRPGADACGVFVTKIAALSADILQMEASDGPRLRPLPPFFKSAASQWASDAGGNALALRRERISSEFSVIEARLSRDFCRKARHRTLYAVDRSGGDRSSAINRRMSPKRFLGMATSAIWNATQRPWLMTFAPIGTRL